MSGWTVRGITRDPESEKAQAWKAKGAKLVKADLDDIDSLEAAFKGSHAIFAVTDYVNSITKVLGSPDLLKQAEHEGKSPLYLAGDLERQQGVNAAEAATRPAVLETLERYVFSTLPGLSKLSGGKYSHAPEFDAKAAAEQYIRDRLPQLNAVTSFIVCGNYLENWAYIPVLGPQKEADGSFSFVSPDVPGGDAEVPELWVSKDTGVFVEALVLHQKPGIKAFAHTAIISTKTYAERWSKVLGLRAQPKVLSKDDYAALIPEEARDVLMDMFGFGNEFGFLAPDMKTAKELGIKTSTLEDFIRAQDWKL